MYALAYDPRIEKDVRRIPKVDRQAIFERITRLQTNPRQMGVEKLEAEEGYRLRVGHYRVLFTINDKTRTIEIYRIKHRKEAYR